MNKVVTSQEEILKTSRELIQKRGWSAINIRSVASACGVSIGSIYNYYSSKSELITATIESIWTDIFHMGNDEMPFSDTEQCILWIYQCIRSGDEKYPGFFTLHSLSFIQEDREDGKNRMKHAWQHVLHGICMVIKQDPRVRPNAFTEDFTPEHFADLLFSQMLSSMIRKDFSTNTILEVIRRVLY
ncbi:MAG: TetR/AcrR family transcriptional regulator [Lachnospiraceae bacterium]|nr:TetR/AcrR family transcriptional regulator [Lachnospiraceae bacterium]